MDKRTEFNDAEKKILDALVTGFIACKEVGYPFDAAVRLMEIVRHLRDNINPKGLELLLSVMKEEKKSKKRVKKKTGA